MLKKALRLAAAWLPLGPILAAAAPVEMDTPAAHVIVIRTLDVWSGDVSGMKDSLERVRDKVASYGVTIGYKRVRALASRKGMSARSQGSTSIAT